MENLNKTEQIVDSVYDAGWNGAIEAVKMGDKAFAQGVKKGRRKGFLLGLIVAIAGTSLGIAAKDGAFDNIPNPFKKAKKNDLEDFEVDEFDDAN